jgi:hypothetical protein
VTDQRATKAPQASHDEIVASPEFDACPEWCDGLHVTLGMLEHGRVIVESEDATGGSGFSVFLHSYEEDTHVGYVESDRTGSRIFRMTPKQAERRAQALADAVATLRGAALIITGAAATGRKQ